MASSGGSNGSANALSLLSRLTPSLCHPLRLQGLSTFLDVPYAVDQLIHRISAVPWLAASGSLGPRWSPPPGSSIPPLL